jgi:hypothetical protein
MRSRVMPGSLVTMERRVPVRRLKSVDLPTLGRPTMTMDGRFGVIWLRTGDGEGYRLSSKGAERGHVIRAREWKACFGRMRCGVLF